MSPLFHRKSIVTQETLGEKLKKVRLGKNWTLKDASRHSKIALDYIKALEECRYDDIPGEVYIKNFIRVYSRKLGLNPVNCLNLYKTEQHTLLKHKYAHSLKEIDKAPFKDRLLKPGTLKRATICTLLFIVLSYIVFNMYESIAPPTLFLTYPREDTTTTDLILQIRGSSDPNARVMVNHKEVIINNDGTFAEELSLRYGLNLIVVSAKRKHGLERKIIRHVLVKKQLFSQR